jgi:hypothetical protein
MGAIGVELDPMADSSAKVACGNCSRLLEERSDISLDERQPCPVCGSTSRAFSLEASAGVYAVSGFEATLVPSEAVSADEAPIATEIRGIFEATLRWHKLTGDAWMVQVVNSNGEIVEGGLGDNAEEALLEIYERVIPPTDAD